MTNSVGTFLGVFSLLLVVFAAAPAVAQFEETMSTAQGRLLTVDPDAQKIVIEKETAQQMEFTYHGDTQIVGAEGVEALAGAEAFVRVHYRSEGPDLVAERIEVLE